MWFKFGVKEHTSLFKKKSFPRKVTVLVKISNLVVGIDFGPSLSTLLDSAVSITESLIAVAYSYRRRRHSSLKPSIRCNDGAREHQFLSVHESCRLRTSVVVVIQQLPFHYFPRANNCCTVLQGNRLIFGLTIKSRGNLILPSAVIDVNGCHMVCLSKQSLGRARTPL